jgi:neurofibromin 1
VKISACSFSIVLDALLSLLEDLARPHNAVLSHPPHVLLSELYVLELIADCCASSWYRPRGSGDGSSSSPVPEGPLSPAQRAAFPPPETLRDAQLQRIFEVVKLLFEPIPDGYTLPAKVILDDSSAERILTPPPEEPSRTPLSSSSSEPPETRSLLQAHASAIEAHVKLIVEYVTASSWPLSFEYFRNVAYAARSDLPAKGSPITTAAAAEEERAALVMMRTVSYVWADSQKLGLVIQEFCSSFLHFRKSIQNTIAIVVPQLIMRWLDRYPGEFVDLHSDHGPRRRETAPDTLFDMALTIGNNGQRKALLFPMQMALLFLQPDVFEVASNLRESKGSGMVKKVQFLDGLRKALRNRNEQAAYCLVLLLRVARHFEGESDSALMSYAMDVQDEVRDAVFRRFAPGADGVLYEQDIMTAAFVSASHLNFEHAVESLAVSCLSSSAPHSFKIAVIQACAHFARLTDSHKYQPLFTATSAFIQAQLQVCTPFFVCRGPLTATDSPAKDLFRASSRGIRRRTCRPEENGGERPFHQHGVQHTQLP